MTKRFIMTGIGGFLIGVAAMMLTAFSAAPNLMISEDESLFNFEDTVELIKNTAAEQNWKVPTVHMIHDAVSPYGYEVDRVAVLELCQPHHAGKILAEDRAKVVTSMMPCRVSVYETADPQPAVEAHFGQMPSISIDYGVLERSDRVRLVPCDIGWSDVGSWDAVHDLAEQDDRGNALHGNALAIDCDNTLLHGNGRLVAAVGVRDLCVVETADAILKSVIR
ncbi:MAG: DUF302 domain-containing protein [Thioalkalivibrio sp.]|nr:DUF302 domain-containing protein [Thioalkalivibrio sp.]